MLTRRSYRGPELRRRYLVAFQLAGRNLAMPAEQLFAVAELSHFVPLPNASPWNLGVAPFRGSLVGIFDLLALLSGTPKRLPNPPFACVLVKAPGGVAGFPVDALQGLETVVGDAAPQGSWRIDTQTLERLG